MLHLYQQVADVCVQTRCNDYIDCQAKSLRGRLGGVAATRLNLGQKEKNKKSILSTEGAIFLKN